MLNNILFPRFKKKTLKLACIIYPEHLTYMLDDIRNKKIFQSILHNETTNSVEEKTIIDHNDINTNIEKINEIQIAFASSESNKIKLWNLHKGICIKTLIHDDYIRYIVKMNKTQIISSSDLTIKIWDISTGKSYLQLNVILLILSITVQLDYGI